MATISEPLKIEDYDKNENWFNRTLLKIGALSLTTFGLYKIKGPTGSLVSKYINKQNLIIAQREENKRIDRQRYELGPDATIHQQNFGNRIDQNLRTQVLKEVEEINIQQARTLAKKASRIEESIVSQGSKDMNKSLTKINTNDFVGMIDTSLTNDEINEIFFQIRKASLSEYLTTNLGLEDIDRSTLESMQNEKLHSKQLKGLHDNYLYNSREYAEIYNRNLSGMVRLYKADKKIFDAQAPNQVYNKEDFKNRLYGSSYFDKTPETAAELTRISRYVRKPTVKHDVFDIIKSGTKITSGSLDASNKMSTDKLGKLLGQFNYTPLLKKLGEKLNDLSQGYRKDKTKVSGVNYEIISRSELTKQPNYLRITFHHEKHVNKTYSIEIPISQWGAFSGSTPSIGERLDGLYLTDSAVVKRLSTKYGDVMNLKINDDLENTTQLMLRKLISRLDSNIMETDFSINPNAAISKIANELNTMANFAERVEGNVRDEIKKFAIRTQERYSSPNSLAGLSEAISSIKHMQLIHKLSKMPGNKRKNSSIISVDFETISRELPGPNHIVIDPFTQVTKIAYTVSRMEDGKFKTFDADDVISDHGVKILSETEPTSNDLANWLKRDLGSKSNDMSNEEVWTTWSKKISEQVKMYKQRKGGRAFTSNTDMVKHYAQILLQKIKSEIDSTGNEVFIMTKNSSFDLHLLERFAGPEWQKIKRIVKFIDIQAIAKYEKVLSSDNDSLALNKMIIRLLGGNNPNQYNIDEVGNSENAFRAISKKIPITIEENLNNMLKKRGAWTAAHSEPIADLMFENVLLVDQYHRIASGHKNFENLSDIEKHYLTNKGTDIQQNFIDFVLNEQAWSVEGMLASSSALSQGNISKKITSLISMNMLMPIPNNPLGKQFDQLFMGNAVRPKNVKNIKDRVNLKDRKLKDRYWTPILTTQAEVSLSNSFLASNAYENYYSNHIYAKSIAIWNPWKGKEGYFALSENALKNHVFTIKKTVDLSDAITKAETVGISNIELQVIKKIRNKAKQFANGGGISQNNWTEAAKAVMSEMSNGKQGIVLPKGTNLLARSDGGLKSIQEEFNGYITNISIGTNISDQIKLQANVEYNISGPELFSQAFNVRSLVAKASRSKFDILSQGVAYGGVDAIMNADFMDKGYVGAMKQVLLEKTIEKLIIKKNTAKNKYEVDDATAKLDRLKSKIHATDLGISLLQDPYASPKFTHITNPNDVKLAQKYFGNIDLSMKELGSFMVDAGIKWDLESAKNWYKMAGGNNIAKGQELMKQWVETSLAKSIDTLNQQRNSVNGVLSHLSKEEFTNLRDDLTTTFREWHLPNLDRIAKGAQIPKFMEAVKLDNNPDTPFEIGFFHTSAISVYNLNKGSNVKTKNVKFRGNLLQQINTPYTHVSESTLNHLKRNKRGFIEKRFIDAMGTYERFTNALIGKAMTEIKDLSIEELQILNNRLGTLSLNKVKRWNLNDSKLAQIKEDLTSRFMEEYGDNPEKYEKAVNSILEEIQENRLEKQIENSKTFVSVDATHAIAQLGKDKGVFAYSKDKRLGGTFDFNIRELLLNCNTIRPEDRLTAEAELIQTFNVLEKEGNGLGVKVNKLAKGGPVISLDRVIFHADASPENVANMINLKEGDMAFGFLTEANKYRNRSTVALEEYQKKIDQFANKQISRDVVEGQEFLFKKFYLEYMLKGFLLDSSSIYSRSHELAPVGARVKVLGANTLFDSAKKLSGRLGEKKFSHLKKFETVINRISTASNLADVFIHEEMGKKLKVDHNLSIKEHFKNIFGVDSNEYKNAMEKIFNGEDPLYGYMSRNPTIHAGYDAILDKRINIIPGELANALGIGINEAHVFAEHGKVFNMDFDGDFGELILHGFKVNQSMAGYQKVHSSELQASIQKVMTSVIAGGKTLAEDVNQPEIFGFLNGKLLARSIDPKTGGFIDHAISADSPDAAKIMTKGFFGKSIENFKTSALEGFGVITKKTVQTYIDQLAFVGVSKNMIGLFTNMNLVRSRQLMSVDKLAGDSVLAKSLLGNLNEGAAGLSQMFISLAKHKQNFEQLAQASKAVINPYTNDAVAQNALRGVYESFYSETEQGTEYGRKMYDKNREIWDAFATAAPSRSEVHNVVKSYENIDLMKDYANILDEINTRSSVDFIRDNMLPDVSRRSNVSEFGDFLTKKFKLDNANIRGSFKKGGKIAAIGAAVYIAANFFRPNQLSNSMSPLDAFTDLGVDIDGNHNAIASSLELDRSLPLDMVNASFSKQTFIKMNDKGTGKHDQERSSIINKLLEKSFNQSSNLIYDWRTSPNLSYTNYTTNINSLGSNQLSRRY